MTEKKAEKKPAAKRTRKAGKTAADAQTEIYMYCTERGWSECPGPLDALYNSAVSHDGLQMRLNFGDDEVLRMQVRRPLTDEEKATPELRGRGSIWETIEESKYVDVELGESSLLVFAEKPKTMDGEGE